MPNQIIGIRPTGVMMVCKKSDTDTYCTEYKMFASGLSFVYLAVDLDRVQISPDSPQGADSYKPCFTNDAALAEATLTIHLTPLSRVLDPGHCHEKYVWGQMVSMYPWMEEEIQGIDFCPDFNPSTCPASCGSQATHASKRVAAPEKILAGPSDDCQVPIMVLPIVHVPNHKK